LPEIAFDFPKFAGQTENYFLIFVFSQNLETKFSHLAQSRFARGHSAKPKKQANYGRFAQINFI
jgi:hypothetical protein